MEDMEGQRQAELKSLQEEKEQLKKLVEEQKGTIEELKQQLQRTSEDNTELRQQQHELEETVNKLIQSISVPSCECAPQPDTTWGNVGGKTSGRHQITQSHRQLVREWMVETLLLGDLAHKITGELRSL